MQRIERTYEKILAYLKDLLSDRERHDLEKAVMQDAFDEEAFEGLNTLSGEEFEAEMTGLNNRLDKRISRKPATGRIWLYRIAASVVFIAGIGVALYFVLKQPEQVLITQQYHKDMQTKPEQQSSAETDGILKELPLSNDSLVLAKRSRATADSSRNIALDDIAEETTEIESGALTVQAEAYGEKIAEPVMEEEMDEAVARAIVNEPEEESTITGRVLGVNREALAGVSVEDKVSKRSTLTDIDGYFKMPMSNPDSRLAFNYIGYKSAEVTSKEIACDEIILEENLVAMNEVVVVGYGTKSRAEKSAPTTGARKSTAADYRSPASYTKPVPPGGSLKKFQDWVEDHIDTMNLKTVLQGNYRISVSMHINEDGSLENVVVKNNVPEVVAEEYRRAVLLSRPWQPATSDRTPVDAEIIIEFSLIVK